MRRAFDCSKFSRSRAAFLPGCRLCVLALLLVLPVLIGTAFAQEPSENKQIESDVETLMKAEADIQLVVSGNTLRSTDLAMRAQRRLKGILQRDPASPLRLRIEQDLAPIQEILGRHNLDIASFYLSREHGGTRGAEVRLLSIVTDYPRFSRMDEVMFQLSTVSLRDDRRDDARNYLWKLVCNYPTSEQMVLAFERLNQIGFGSWEGCDKFKP
jgi:hypothetical protein